MSLHCISLAAAALAVAFALPASGQRAGPRRTGSSWKPSASAATRRAPRAASPNQGHEWLVGLPIIGGNQSAGRQLR